MDKVRFFFSETLMALGLAFLGLVAAKAVGALQAGGSPKNQNRRLAVVRGLLYTAILALVILGARGLGTGVSAGVRALASEGDANTIQLERGYQNALRAVQLRPGNADYWRILSASKFRLGQFNSVLKDQPVLEALSGGKLDEENTMRLAYCHYLLGQYDQVYPLTAGVIQAHRYFAAPYVLEGMTYMAQKKYAQARQRFLDVLQLFPSQEAAVEGLAHAHFLMGDAANALRVLNETQKFPFPPEARKRFDDLKIFYAQ